MVKEPDDFPAEKVEKIMSFGRISQRQNSSTYGYS